MDFKKCRKLPQTTIIEDMSEFILTVHQTMLMSALEKADEPQDVKELLTELFSSANYPFGGLETNYLQQ